LNRSQLLDARCEVLLSGVSWSLIQEALATPDVVIAARVATIFRDGGDACATIPLLDGGWRIMQKRHHSV
jgi:hypothetical protein